MINKYSELANYIKTKIEFETRYNLIEDEPETGDFVMSNGKTRAEELEKLNSDLADMEDKNPWIIDIIEILESEE